MIFFRIWYGFRRFTTWLGLAVMYFAVITPMSLLLRVLGEPRSTGWVPHIAVNERGSGVLALLQFLRTRKRYWLLPIVIVMLVLGLLLALSEGAAIAPFIYTLF